MRPIIHGETTTNPGEDKRRIVDWCKLIAKIEDYTIF